MATIVVMPQLGNSVESCIIVEWMIAEGDTVSVDQTLASIETDKSTMEVPSTAEGTVLNAAPQNPGPGNTPIWAGHGAGEIGDTDKFEGETYTLDLISVDGPGRMEMFIDNGDSVNRFLSSHDTAYRSVYNPRHTHLYTTFTQPGRYVANYKMTARSADGTAIYSSPITPLVWQVGGANPADGTIKDIVSAYNGARAERTDGNTATHMNHDQAKGIISNLVFLCITLGNSLLV